MRKFVLIIVGILFFNVVNAQDIILKKNGDEINAKIQEVGVNEIKYKKFDNLDGPVYTILKAEVFMIKYANGSKDVFTADTPNSNVPVNNTVAPSASAEKATVIIYRLNKPTPASMSTNYDIYADTRYLTKVQNNTYFVTKLDSGQVTFNALTEPPKVTVSITLEPGKTYYLKCSFSTGMWVGRPILEFVSESIGATETAKMK